MMRGYRLHSCAMLTRRIYTAQGYLDGTYLIIYAGSTLGFARNFHNITLISRAFDAFSANSYKLQVDTYLGTSQAQDHTADSSSR